MARTLKSCKAGEQRVIVKRSVCMKSTVGKRGRPKSNKPPKVSSGKKRSKRGKKPEVTPTSVAVWKGDHWETRKRSKKGRKVGSKNKKPRKTKKSVAATGRDMMEIMNYL